jgi:hypothetical protein
MVLQGYFDIVSCYIDLSNQALLGTRQKKKPCGSRPKSPHPYDRPIGQVKVHLALESPSLVLVINDTKLLISLCQVN